MFVDEYCGGELCESGCVYWRESRCSGADSSALCILKPLLPPAAKIELGDGEGRCIGGAVVLKGGGSDITPRGAPSLSCLLAEFI